jgi:hypothetical protein
MSTLFSTRAAAAALISTAAVGLTANDDSALGRAVVVDALKLNMRAPVDKGLIIDLSGLSIGDSLHKFNKELLGCTDDLLNEFDPELVEKVRMSRIMKIKGEAEAGIVGETERAGGSDRDSDCASDTSRLAALKAANAKENHFAEVHAASAIVDLKDVPTPSGSLPWWQTSKNQPGSISALVAGQYSVWSQGRLAALKAATAQENHFGEVHAASGSESDSDSGSEWSEISEEYAEKQQIGRSLRAALNKALESPEPTGVTAGRTESPRTKSVISGATSPVTVIPTQTDADAGHRNELRIAIENFSKKELRCVSEGTDPVQAGAAGSSDGRSDLLKQIRGGAAKAKLKAVEKPAGAEPQTKAQAGSGIYSSLIDKVKAWQEATSISDGDDDEWE